ncbi:MAG: EutN/CcmL family microcompartment protein [Planctomycetia bacterium]|jgi:ethanolamine utilization protein EutN
MRIAKVIGSVTLSRTHPSLIGARWKVAVPLMLDDLKGEGGPPCEELVVYDDIGAGEGSLIAVSEGREASMPFHPDYKPVDAYNSAILDHIHIQ